MTATDDLDVLIADLPRHDASDTLVARTLARIEADQAYARSEELAAEHAREQAEQDANAARRLRHLRVARWSALAAGLVFALGTWAVITNTPDPVAPGLMIKGTPAVTQASMTLGLSLLRNDVPVALEPGAAALPSDKVLLRYTTDREGFAYLFRRGPDGAVEVFHGTATLPGTHHVTVGGQIVGYGLDGLTGEHRFGVAWSDEPWSPMDGAAARPPDGFAGAIAVGSFPRGLRGSLQGVVVDSRPVQIERR